MRETSPGLANESRISNMNFAKVPCATLPTPYGNFAVYGFRDLDSGEEAVALMAGSAPGEDSIPMVRIHSQCLTGDVFGSARCDCRDQLHTSMQLISEAGFGVLVYQQQEGRGIGLINKIRAYELQDQGLDTVSANQELGFQADQREYRMPAEILKYLGFRTIRLLSNNPEKVRALEKEGLQVHQRIPLEITPNSSTRDYLRIKKEKLGHFLSKV
jgi:GTP cyclohydrolase II